MEFRITECQIPGKISFNYEELKQALTERVSDFKTIVYTDDQISVAKKDRAELNKLKKAINDERIRQEKEFIKPFETFKAQVKELCDIIDTATKSVDAQVKAYEDAQREQKKSDINAYWEAKEVPEWMCHIEDKWLNASVSLTSVQKDIDASVEQMKTDMSVIDKLPSFIFEAEEVYKRTHSLSDALKVAQLAQEDAERKAAWEAEKRNTDEQTKVVSAAEGSEIKRKWIGFQAYLSADEAKLLGNFLKQNGIKYKAI